MEEKRRLEAKYEQRERERESGSDRRDQTRTIQNFPHPRHFTVTTPRPALPTLLRRAFFPSYPYPLIYCCSCPTNSAPWLTHGSSNRGLTKQCDCSSASWFSLPHSRQNSTLKNEKKVIILTSTREYNQLWMYKRTQSTWVLSAKLVLLKIIVASDSH